jgi:putative SOS response-associated peptidase YedK
VCGRYVSVRSDGDLTAEFDVEQVVGEQLAPSWNVAPTDAVRIVLDRRQPGADPPAPTVRQLRTAGWGLVPSWSRSRTRGATMINARSETVAERPAFKAAAARRRCLAPAAGYFEWQQQHGRKTPYFLHAADDGTLAMAGLYEIWHDASLPEDDPAAWVWTCTVITRAATDSLGHIHDRCPVLVPHELRAAWLDCSAGDAGVAGRLLAAIPEPHLVPRRVSPAVGNVRNNGPELIAPVDPGIESPSLRLFE